MADKHGRPTRCDIPDWDVLILARDRWAFIRTMPPRSADGYPPTPVEVLADKYPPKVTRAKMERLVDRGLMEYGSSVDAAWLTAKGEAYLHG